MPDRQLCGFRKKEEERLLRANVVGVGEAVSDQHRANSLNTGWVKVPVKFPALAVVGAAHGRGENAGQPKSSTNCNSADGSTVWSAKEIETLLAARPER